MTISRVYKKSKKISKRTCPLAVVCECSTWPADTDSHFAFRQESARIERSHGELLASGIEEGDLGLVLDKFL